MFLTIPCPFASLSEDMNIKENESSPEFLISLLVISPHESLGWRQVNVNMKSLSRVRLFATPWAVAYQAPLSMGFFQAIVLEWIAISFSRDLPDPGIEPRSPAL